MTEESGKDRRGTESEIVLVPDGVSLRGSPGSTLLQVLQENGVPIAGSCGGQGTCGECRVRFVGRAPEPTPSDLDLLDPGSIAAGWRLACAHAVQGTVRIEVRAPDGDLDQKAQGDARAPEGELDPAVTSRIVDVANRSREDRRPLAERLGEARSGEPRIPLHVLQRLASAQRTGPLTVIEAECGILDVIAGRVGSVHGLAIDIGTTTLAVYLFDLETGRQLGVAASRNPQQRFGADVISRIAHVRRTKGEGLTELHASAVEGLNGLISRIAGEASVSPEVIYQATAVGNPTMLHLLLGIDPRGIDVSPYVPVFRHGVRCSAGDIGLAIAPRGVVETLPAVSAYVGADIVAGILATDLEGREGSTLFLDVGTNGEIVLALDGRLIACSTAAGPAFEGASIVQGMAALDGAIESVRVVDGHVECTAIGGAQLVGLCGTGLVSAVAELYAAGVIEPSGRFRDPGSPLADRLEGMRKDRRFRLTDGAAVYLHQSDVREFQLAKAAVRAGIEVLLRGAGLPAEKLDRVLIGGAFSARLSGEHLTRTGLLPEIDPSRIHVVGNTAGWGAKRVLLNRRLTADAKRLARSVEYVELSADRSFRDLYVAQIPFPDG